MNEVFAYVNHSKIKLAPKLDSNSVACVLHRNTSLTLTFPSRVSLWANQYYKSKHNSILLWNFRHVMSGIDYCQNKVGQTSLFWWWKTVFSEQTHWLDVCFYWQFERLERLFSLSLPEWYETVTKLRSLGTWITTLFENSKYIVCLHSEWCNNTPIICNMILIL